MAQRDRVPPISYLLELAKTQGVSLRLAEMHARTTRRLSRMPLSGRYFPGVIEVVEKDGSRSQNAQKE